MIRNLCLILVVAVVAIGCVSAKATMLNPGVRWEPVPFEAVVVYYSEKDVPGAFDTIAIVRCEGKEVLTTEKQMLLKMRQKAGAIGANAIVLTRIKDPGDMERWADVASGGLGFASRKFQAIAIRVREK
jgi:hypothetical protein